MSWFAAQVMFDYPTVADLTDYIVAQFSDGDEGDEAAVGGLLAVCAAVLQCISTKK